MYLTTGKTITSTKFHPLLITTTVIKQVEKLATRQGILSFKITTRDGMILYDSAKIAGVDNEEATNNNETNDNDSIIEEYEIQNEEFEEIEEPYESSEDDEEASEYSMASNEEANYEQNNNEEEK